MDGSHNRSLQEFGENFLGPVLGFYLRQVVDRCSEGRLPVCLAREGFLMHRALSALSQEEHIGLPQQPVYLQLSRTLLFRALLSDPASWEVMLSPLYKGTIGDLLRGRFALSLTQIDSIVSSKQQARKIQLPEDLNLIFSVLRKALPQIEAWFLPLRRTFTDYCRSAGLDDSANAALLLDVGYSGTIQKLLGLLLEVDTEGLYLIASRPGETEVSGYRARMTGVIKEGVKLGDGYVMLDRSLFLECLMTAPHGQVIDVAKGPDGSFDFVYGRTAPAQRYAQNLEAVHKGAIEGVLHQFRHDIHFSVAEIEQMYETFVMTPGAIPETIWHLFAADDDISGNGIISPLRFFGLA